MTDALLPFIPSLVAWGHSEDALVEVMDELARAVEPAVQVTVVYVHDDPGTALRRAVEREGDAWGDWYVAKLAGSPGTRAVHDLESAADHLRREEDLTRRLLARSPWRLLTVDAGALGAREAAAHARHRLAAADVPRLADHGSTRSPAS